MSAAHSNGDDPSPVERDVLRCESCGYDLTGLSEPYCPACEGGEQESRSLSGEEDECDEESGRDREETASDVAPDDGGQTFGKFFAPIAAFVLLVILVICDVVAINSAAPSGGRWAGIGFAAFLLPATVIGMVVGVIGLFIGRFRLLFLVALGVLASAFVVGAVLLPT